MLVVSTEPYDVPGVEMNWQPMTGADAARYVEQLAVDHMNSSRPIGMSPKELEESYAHAEQCWAGWPAVWVADYTACEHVNEALRKLAAEQEKLPEPTLDVIAIRMSGTTDFTVEGAGPDSTMEGVDPTCMIFAADPLTIPDHEPSWCAGWLPMRPVYALELLGALVNADVKEVWAAQHRNTADPPPGLRRTGERRPQT